MPRWLLVSVVASLVLTTALNVALRLMPNAARRLGDRLERVADRPHGGQPREQESRRAVRVVFPWKVMLIVSLALTLVLNVLLRLR